MRYYSCSYINNTPKDFVDFIGLDSSNLLLGDLVDRICLFYTSYIIKIMGYFHFSNPVLHKQKCDVFLADK